jgi:hypothetical protein
MKRNRAPTAAARFLRTLPSQVLLRPPVGRSTYERRKHCKSPLSYSPTSPAAARPAAARTKLLLEGPVLHTPLRLAAPNIRSLAPAATTSTLVKHHDHINGKAWQSEDRAS